jgi:hypothetical protein
MLDAKPFVLRQAVEQPTKPTEITSSDLLPSKAVRSGVWQWFRLAKHIDVPKGKSAMPNFSEHIVIRVWRME